MGLYQIAKAVSFLNNECSLVRHFLDTKLISSCASAETLMKLFWQVFYALDVYMP